MPAAGRASRPRGHPAQAVELEDGLADAPGGDLSAQVENARASLAGHAERAEGELSRLLEEARTATGAARADAARAEAAAEAIEAQLAHAAQASKRNSPARRRRRPASGRMGPSRPWPTRDHGPTTRTKRPPRSGGEVERAERIAALVGEGGSDRAGRHGRRGAARRWPSAGRLARRKRPRRREAAASIQQALGSAEAGRSIQQALGSAEDLAASAGENATAAQHAADQIEAARLADRSRPRSIARR